MKLLLFYTIDCMKRNRRSSMAIMIAILMTATMMSSLCGYLYNIYADNLSLILRESGNWHGELYDNTPGSTLPIIEGFESIEATMIKGDWKVAQIDDPRRDYLVWRDANSAYWQSMPEGDSAILEGRTPTRAGEIALSKQYFEHHPELKMGDTLILPLGNRVHADGSLIISQDVKQSGEQFLQTGTVSLTVVGKLDVATSSTVPAYTALGFLDNASILPQDDLTIYFRFHNIHSTYRELPKIAAAVGYEQDEYGNYLLRYNTGYLTRRAVLSPEQTGMVPLLLANQMILMFVVMGLLMVGLFVLIIHNAFTMSSSARLSQLGIFASVGATPKQIKRSVILEALLLTTIPLPLGLLIGQLSVYFLIEFVNRAMVSSDIESMTFVVGWQSLLPAIVLTLITVSWSALIPARKIARMSPIEAIRQGGAEKLKKPRRFSVTKLCGLFGISGELAANALHARRKSYRTATISLMLSFLTLVSLVCINSASTASEAVYQADKKYWAEQDILLTLYDVPTEEDFSLINGKISGLEEISNLRWYNKLRTAAWIPEDGFSAAFEEKGGFTAVEKKLSGQQVPLLRDGQRRVNITILGLDDKTFSEYCAKMAIDPILFYQGDHWRSILYHTVNDVTTGTKRTPVPIPFLNIASGDNLRLTEATTDSYEGDFAFDMEIAAITNEMPPIGGATFSVRYSAVQIMPMSQVKKLASYFTNNSLTRVNGVLEVSEPAQISKTRAELEQICESYYGSGDYDLFDESEFYTNDVSGEQMTAMLFGFVVLLLTIIGLSNAWATVSGTLNARRREFAMLRSVGLPPKGLKKMLTLEAMILGLTPILLSLPFVVALQWLFLYINEVSFVEWLPFAPWIPLLLYTVVVLAVIVGAYAIGGNRLLRENIIESIKMDSL